MNSSSRKTATVALIILKQISKVSPRNSKALIYFADKCPFDLRYLNGGVKTTIYNEIKFFWIGSKNRFS